MVNKYFINLHSKTVMNDYAIFATLIKSQIPVSFGGPEKCSKAELARRANYSLQRKSEKN
jgi:hypothetical protein